MKSVEDRINCGTLANSTMASNIPDPLLLELPLISIREFTSMAPRLMDQESELYFPTYHSKKVQIESARIQLSAR